MGCKYLKWGCYCEKRQEMFQVYDKPCSIMCKDYCKDNFCRSDVKEMTIEQIEKELGYKIKVVSDN